MPASDVAYTFDPSMVLGGVGKINDALGKMTENIKGAAGSMSKAVTRGVLKAAAVVGSLVMAFKGIRSAVREHIPEIGEAFKIAKGIFFKNFLFPLRKELMPLLQKMLDWARDNRARFVKWGQAVANVFRAIVAVAKKVIQWGRGILEQIGRVFGALFGDSVNSIAEAWNLITAKIAIAAIFVGNIIQGLIGWFGDLAETFGPKVIGTLGEVIDLLGSIVTEIWPSIKRGGKALFAGTLDSALAFIDGFLEGVDGISAPIGEIFDSIATFIEGLFEPNQFGDKLQNVFKTIGKIIGALFLNLTTIVAAFLDPFLERLRNVATPLQDIADSLKDMFDRLFDREGMENMQSFASILGEIAGTAIMTGLRTVALLIALIANSIVLLRDALRMLFEGGRFQEFFGDIGGFFRGEGRFKDIFSFSGADPERREAAAESSERLSRDFKEGLSAIMRELGIGDDGTVINHNAPGFTISSPITIYSLPGQSPEEIATETAKQFVGPVSEIIDRERRGLGD